jgi:hypothetical protein
MQNDAANFESIALMCRCVEPGCKVEIDFAPSGWYETIEKKRVKFEGWNERFGKKSSGANAYLRFLYRADIFRRAFDWVSFSGEASEEIDKFTKLLGKSQCSNNIPNRMAEYNKTRGGEYDIEYKLSHSEKGKKYLADIYREKTKGHLNLGTINNQLPNGLFAIAASEAPKEENRIFTSGAYDIWAIDKGGYFCVFELKKESGNEKLGIISELFFYATYAHDVLLNKERLHEKKPKVNHRGYGELYGDIKNGKIKGVNAFFLLTEKGGINAYIDKVKPKLIEELNKNKFSVHFDFLHYNFDRISEIKSDEVKEDVRVK